MGDKPVIRGAICQPQHVTGSVTSATPHFKSAMHSAGPAGIVDYDEVVRRTSYRHQQQVASAAWHIEHNLGFYPSVFVADTSGNWVIGDVQYHDENSVTLTFNASFSGEAFFS